MTLSRTSMALIALAFGVLSGCASTPDVQSETTSKAGEVCTSGNVHLYTDFPAAKVDACEVRNGEFQLTILPEAENINPSPWYAFRLEADTPQMVRVSLTYPTYKHRYVPKISLDTQTWTALPDHALWVAEDRHKARLAVNVGEAPLYVAAQELITVEDYQNWESDLLDNYLFLTSRTLGKSVEGRDITILEALAIGAARPTGTLVLIGRQHPPEVTGAVAYMAFTEELLGDSALAREFRTDYSVSMVSLVNPDGVESGHWRLNANGIDLNRDWGPFTQPETRLVRDELARIDTRDRLALFLDFHSTKRNVLYTQNDNQPTRPHAFAAKWFAAMNTNDPDFGMQRSPEKITQNKPTSKAYVYKTYGIAAITYEMDDKVDRQKAREFARMAAREMMTLLLNNYERPDE